MYREQNVNTDMRPEGQGGGENCKKERRTEKKREEQRRGEND